MKEFPDNPEEFDRRMRSLVANKANLDAAIQQAIIHVMEQREEILTAFVAKYGYDPDQAVQVQFTDANGNMAWAVREKMKTDPV